MKSNPCLFCSFCSFCSFFCLFLCTFRKINNCMCNLVSRSQTGYARLCATNRTGQSRIPKEGYLSNSSMHSLISWPSHCPVIDQQPKSLKSQVTWQCKKIYTCFISFVNERKCLFLDWFIYSFYINVKSLLTTASASMTISACVCVCVCVCGSMQTGESKSQKCKHIHYCKISGASTVLWM